MIDIETLMNDKKLLLEENQDLRERVTAYKVLNDTAKEELANAWNQIYSLTAEVNRLTELVAAAQVK